MNDETATAPALPLGHLRHLVPSIRRRLPRGSKIVAAAPHPTDPEGLPGLIVHHAAGPETWTIDGAAWRSIDPRAWRAAPHATPHPDGSF